jgi:hypothetical protein
MYVDTKEPVAAEPTLRDLAYALRHKEMWPEGFSWDYRYSESCAIGLCYKLYDRAPSNFDEFNGDYDGNSSYMLFCTPVSFFKYPLTLRSERMHMVTPEMVADRIDDYLGGKHAEVVEADLDFTGRPY